jgi:alpha-glucosidase (family GH31 glycosyl hydrolase)
MRYSVSGVLSFTSIFGIPMVGSDIWYVDLKPDYVKNLPITLCLHECLLYVLVYTVNNLRVISGFINDTDEELCLRWTQLGIVSYPFARNHNIIDARSQEPYHWASVASAAKWFLRNVRYKLEGP